MKAMLSAEILDRLESQARAQQGREIGTGVVVMPGELLALLAGYRVQQQPIIPAESAKPKEGNSMNVSISSVASPFWAIPLTKDAVLSNWFEVFAAFDTRGGPQIVCVMAIDEDHRPVPWDMNSSIEVELPEGIAMALENNGGPSYIMRIDFPCRWRINKFKADWPVGFVVFGYGPSSTTES